MSEQSSGSPLGLSNWHALIPKFGEEVAEAAREGFKKYWPKWEPPLPHEKTERNTIENELLVGLTGLALTAEEEFDFRELSFREAHVTTRYAARELSGFPNWLSKLIEAHPEVVKEVFIDTVTADFLVKADEPHPHDVLLSLPDAPIAIQHLCAPVLLKLLKERDPEQNETLQEVLRILIAGNNTKKYELENLAAQRTQANKNDPPKLLSWLSFWLYTEADGALSYLESHLEKLAPEAADGCMIELCNTLRKHSEHRFYQIKPDYLRVSVLNRMIPVVYAHIRPEKDIPREGSYTPGPRDHAERFRDQLVNSLAGTPGESTYHTLIHLAGNSRLISIREWFLNLARERAANDSEHDAWESKDIVDFVKGFESDPTSASDLYHIVINRLSKLKADIETGDYSDRHLFSSDKDEVNVQKWLANRLRLLSRDRYSIEREGEVDRGRKTDIRLQHPRVSGPLVIEVKCANKWSFNKLNADLINQLVGHYLRDARSRHGILLLANLGGKKWWDPRDKSGRLLFPEMVMRLNEKATRIVEDRNDLDILCVFGIDFSH